MNIKLLKQLRRTGRDKIRVYSITANNGCIVGMGYSYDDDTYRGLFSIGDTIDDVKNKAARIYIENYLKQQQQQQ